MSETDAAPEGRPDAEPTSAPAEPTTPPEPARGSGAATAESGGPEGSGPPTPPRLPRRSQPQPELAVQGRIRVGHRRGRRRCRRERGGDHG